MKVLLIDPTWNSVAGVTGAGCCVLRDAVRGGEAVVADEHAGRDAGDVVLLGRGLQHRRELVADRHGRTVIQTGRSGIGLSAACTVRGWLIS